jgi:hypothetical protein
MISSNIICKIINFFAWYLILQVVILKNSLLCVVPNTGFEGASLVKPFHFTLFGRKWLQMALEVGGEALPNRALLKGHDHYLSYLEQILEAARITVTWKNRVSKDYGICSSTPSRICTHFIAAN